MFRDNKKITKFVLVVAHRKFHRNEIHNSIEENVCPKFSLESIASQGTKCQFHAMTKSRQKTVPFSTHSTTTLLETKKRFTKNCDFTVSQFTYIRSPVLFRALPRVFLPECSVQITRILLEQNPPHDFKTFTKKNYEKALDTNFRHRMFSQNAQIRFLNLPHDSKRFNEKKIVTLGRTRYFAILQNHCAIECSFICINTIPSFRVHYTVWHFHELSRLLSSRCLGQITC